MAKFITNIHLLEADGRDYDVLYKALQKESFKKENLDTESKAYVAGKAVFSLEGDLTLQDVNAAVFRASSEAGRTYSFFVMKHKKVS